MEMNSGFPPVLVLLALLLLCCFCSSAGAAKLGTETDRQALLEFKRKITSDPLKLLSWWNDTLHLCQWQGVTCSQHQRVTQLQLNASKLVGSISPHLGNLSFLRVLNLEGNSFSGEIPREIWDLGRLEEMRLTNNSIVGAIPSNISCFSKIQLLNLGGNHLSGHIPDVLGCLSHLKSLRLLYNRFTGNVPPSLGNLSSLEAFIISSNNLTGAIPESLGQLKNLDRFFVSDNLFTGSLPLAVFNLSSITVFAVVMNRFNGSLPAELGTRYMPHIKEISVFENQFTGTIPPSISNATHLRDFEAGGNKFSGSLPSNLYKLNNLAYFMIGSNQVGTGGENDLNFICSLANATSLDTLDLGLNNFGGAIPECIGNLSSQLRIFWMGNNKLWGRIPSSIGNLVGLESLDLRGNGLSGHIPTNIGSLDKLQELYISRNHLSGSIPFSFGKLKKLIKLAMEENEIEGSIPPSLGECRYLIVLDLSGNNLSGLIPLKLFEFAPFSIGIDLSRNRLTGNIPSQVGNLKSMGALLVSQNLLFGELQISIGSCVSLAILDISANSFRGTIPSSWSSLTGLQVLNLSSNEIVGEIPRFLESLKSLSILDLSYNDFHGVVPSQGIFSNGSATFVPGNNELCGGILELRLPQCKFHRSNKIGKNVILIISLVLGAVFVAAIILICKLRRKGKKSTSSSQLKDDQFMQLSYDVLFRATNGFSTNNLIGTGSFGSVYKGILVENGKLVAIKVINLLQQGSSKSFMAECEALRNVRHRNIVKILTVCSSIDHQRNNFMALVYEFMSNGSLDEWLHRKHEFVNSIQKPRTLNMLQRLAIAVDVACALDYLHNQYATPIVHCDLKPSNVLLDDDLTAHLSDFGLAKFVPDIATVSPQNDTSSIVIRGSIGYMPPEYGVGIEVSTNGDAYSYGVLVLEMFTGRRPTSETFQDGLNLHQFAKAALPSNVMDIIDPTLVPEKQESSDIDMAGVDRAGNKFHRVQECLISIIGIGVACSAELPRERMNMSDVVAELCSIQDKLLKLRLEFI